MTQPALIGTPLSPINADGSANGDAIDSDAALSGANAVVAFTTGGVGINNHSFDIGFFTAPQLSLYPRLNDLGGVVFRGLHMPTVYTRPRASPAMIASLGQVTVTAFLSK